MSTEPTQVNISSPATDSKGDPREAVLHEARVTIRCDLDIIAARQQGRALASELGFTSTELTFIATAISELARNIVAYAIYGDVVLKIVQNGERHGMIIIAHDDGPGISDVRLALQDGYSTSRSLGLGLPGVRRLMDEFEIHSAVGQGTTVIVKKWKA